MVLSFLVGGFAAVNRTLTGTVTTVYAEIRGAFRDAGLAVESAFASGGLAVLDAQAAVNRAIAGAAGDAGFAAPLVIAILFAVAAAATFAALRAFLNAVKWIT
ncbi:hypothetical protein [Halobaculum lipolyticum]|uniref:hypothetical protein n=1 Tax=Halobaculum lipolyticum TaxID=3032001 RepID=UPI0024C25CFA|nr:hypothetical protein [Halobaculum sp. DT31]